MMPTAGRLAVVTATVFLLFTTGSALQPAPAGDDGPVNRRGVYAGRRHPIEVPRNWNGIPEARARAGSRSTLR
jgi:hypothetical protein